MRSRWIKIDPKSFLGGIVDLTIDTRFYKDKDVRFIPPHEYHDEDGEVYWGDGGADAEYDLWSETGSNDASPNTDTNCYDGRYEDWPVDEEE